MGAGTDSRFMKMSLRLCALAAGLALAPFAGAATIPLVGTAIEKAAQALADEIQETSYQDRSALLLKLQAAEMRFDEKLPEWETRKNSLPEKERKEAEVYFRKLVGEREILRQRMDTLDLATAETWVSAKHDLRLALLNALGAYQQLRERFDP
jgi:hypothetical protein